MTTKQKILELLQLLADMALTIFLLLMIVVGLTRDPNAFYFWVPFLSFVLWARVRQARRRWAF
ncbi:MAG: hypothetical protein ACREB7_08255 [Sphingopyxis sp.]|uniref:hypothetical protein n=1 Tax=Sphingopyxis sp. TaxID=1908224 RepID=UPI003D6D7627